MTWLDWVIVAVIGYHLVRGAWRGFIREIFYFVGAFASLLISISYYQLLGDYLSSALHLSRSVSDFVAFLFLTVMVLLLSILVGYLLGKATQSITMFWANRWGGFILGGIKGCILVSILLVMMLLYPLPKTTIPRLKKSYLAPTFLSVAPKIYEVTIRLVNPSSLFNAQQFLDKYYNLVK
jgi:membrane protein required for colicin V production